LLFWRRRRSIVAPVVAALDSLTPFWGPLLLVAAALILDLALPEKLTLGPSWLLPGVEGLLLIGVGVCVPARSPPFAEAPGRWRSL